jgi:retron-type reverse transcriptase
MIEGDIKGCFDNIDHNKLILILKNKIKDETFIKLIFKALRVGYGESRKVIKQNIIGSPQGSIISPIL